MAKPKSSKSKGRTKAKANTSPWIWVGIAAAVLLVVAGYLYFIRPASTPATLPAEVSSQQAYALRQEGALVLDVRQPEEWSEYHIPGATLIPLGELASRVNELPQDKQIVVVCRSGNRSQQGRDILKAAGFQDVTSMAGGVVDWRNAGYPIETGP